ncbi:zinc metalloproteinase-disintegrin-like atrase-A [Eleutherodactylus coqui]|uniref:zinc metalloproteinase-disintegrin-like atrase-A n=1 Tax=Eleutherodactylus coqui TaxID=57060 RepID=UPI00346355C6
MREQTTDKHDCDQMIGAAQNTNWGLLWSATALDHVRQYPSTFGCLYKSSKDQLLYSITIQGKQLTMTLEKQVFLCSDFQAFIDDKVETWLSKFTMSMITASILGMRRYIKVSLFVTVEVYRLLGASPKTVITTLLQVFSYVNTKFVSLKMEIFLSAIDLWTESNLCVIADSVSDTLENFIEWLSGLPSNLKSFNIPLLLVCSVAANIKGLVKYFGILALGPFSISSPVRISDCREIR